MKIRVFLILFIPQVLQGFAQIPTVFSPENASRLKQELQVASGIRRIDLLNQLSLLYAHRDFDTALMYANRALLFSYVLEYEKGVGDAMFNCGNAYFFRLDLENTLVYYLRSQHILENYPPDDELGLLYVQLGNINYYMGRLPRAIMRYKEGLSVFTHLGDDQTCANINNMISVAFWRNRQLDSSVFYQNRRLDYHRKHNNLQQISYSLNNIGVDYMDEQGDPRNRLNKGKASKYLLEALKITEQVRDTDQMSLVYLNLGVLYDDTVSPIGNLEVARQYYEKGYALSLKSSDLCQQAQTLNYLARLDIAQRRYSEADEKLTLSMAKLDTFFLRFFEHTHPSSFSVLFTLNLAKEERDTVFSYRFKLAMAKKEYPEAIKYQQLFFRYKDSVYYDRMQRQFDIMIAEGEAERINQKIFNLSQQNEMNELKASRSRFIFGGMGLFILIVGLSLTFIFYRRNARNQRKSILLEQRMLRSQMNPHFIFNSLTSIQNFILDEQSDNASIYLTRFSKLVRNILESSKEEYIQLEKEISIIENYLALQKIRYKNKFDYKIEMDENTETSMQEIPPMLIQPFIENSIEHGLKNKKSPGMILIRFSTQDHLLTVEIEDNGIGRKRAKELNQDNLSGHLSIATSIAHDRLKLLNRKRKNKITLKIIDLCGTSGEPTGTKVIFELPLR